MSTIHSVLTRGRLVVFWKYINCDLVQRIGFVHFLAGTRVFLLSYPKSPEALWVPTSLPSHYRNLFPRALTNDA